MVIDAAILVAATRGRSSAAILDVAAAAALVTTDRAVEEARRRVSLGMNRPDLLPVLESIIEGVTVVPGADLAGHLGDAQLSLRDATPSRNGSTTDAHVLALAWDVDGDIWSTDRDFAGTGTPVWSTPNLIRALADLR